MCERFTQHYTWKDIQNLYGLTTHKPPTEFPSRYKICPTAAISTVRLVAGKRVFEPMRWGFVPAWWLLGTEPTHPATFNARVETVAKAPFFRAAFERQRCLIPVSGYYEWRETPGGGQPYYFTRRNGAVMAIAGLWDEWCNPDTMELIRSCTMIIGKANTFVAEVCERMPVILEPRQCEAWLSGEAGLKILKPAAKKVLNRHPVSKRVNRVSADNTDETLIEEVAVPDRIAGLARTANRVPKSKVEAV